MSLHLHIPPADAAETKTARRGPVDNMWRVDVAGVPVTVRGEIAYQHLTEVNQRMARMKMALYRILKLPGAGAAFDIALETINADLNGEVHAP